ncbi:MAG: DNA polymerase III subunit alpha [Deltaproteobacteria bacterium]|jgi:DNA polymerase-3 subunit alpha|nr:DNA polymerase III subunit alpha [Deltaproteobacteria bacterium]
MSFVHLHVHSCYSLLDGAIRVEELVKTAKAMGMPAVALTDHGQMMGLWTFYKAARAEGIKPILGVETYVANHGRHARSQNESRHHLILLAQNLVGYHNLCRLISLANLEGFYNKPRVDKEILAQYNEGLIALSGCLQGELPQEILRGSSQERLIDVANSFESIFPGRFYLELQENGIPQQTQVNEALIELAQIASLPLVATNDCHYLLREHHNAHDVLLCVQTHKLLTDENRMRMPTDAFYFKSSEEMAEDFAYCPEALANTLAIAESCDLEFPEKSYRFPVVPLPPGQTAEAILVAKAQAGLKKRLAKMAEKGQVLTPEKEEAYFQRLDYELDVINRMGFPGYFLIVEEFISWAKNHDILVGPGRGSAVGSLVSYSLDISQVDPIRYDLLFERFLNPERQSMPDVDVDFCADGRGQVIRHVAEVYGGHEYVAQILTLNQMKAKAVIRDVGRVLGMDIKEVDPIAKLIPAKTPTNYEKSSVVTIDVALDLEPKLADLVKNNQNVQSLLNYARLLENLPRHASVHASGIVIADRPLMEDIPLCRDSRTEDDEDSNQKGQGITQYELNGVEENGFIKFDFLGLKTLSLIKHCLALLSKKGITIDLEDIPLDDPKAFELLQSGRVNGVFQLESSGIRKVLVQLKPQSIEDISALLSLYRPGPIDGGYVDVFLNVRQGKSKPPSFLPLADPVLKETHGVIVYQEQVMRLAQVLAGFSLAQADELRSAMGKKNAAKMAKMKVTFLEGAIKNGINSETAATVYDTMANFAKYGFNKSHSLAYSFLSYRTAWLKAYYPNEFMAALLTSEMNDFKKLSRFVADCRREGLQVLPPNVNVSDYPFTVQDGQIVYGLGAIKGMGQIAVEAIVAGREDGPYEDLFDFCQRVTSKKITRRVIEALILSGCFDYSGIAREVMKEALPTAMKSAKSSAKKKVVEASLFDDLPVLNPPSKWPKVEPMSLKELLNIEKDYLGGYISAHPLGEFAATFKAIDTMSFNQAKKCLVKTPVTLAGNLTRVIFKTDKNGHEYAFATLEDLDSFIDLVIWNSQLPPIKQYLIPETTVYISGSLDPGKENFGPKVNVNELLPLEMALTRRLKSFYIRTPLEDLPAVSTFLKPHLKLRDNVYSPHVWLGILNEEGEALYELDKTVEFSPKLFTEARDALGYFGEIHCLPPGRPKIGEGRPLSYNALA